MFKKAIASILAVVSIITSTVGVNAYAKTRTVKYRTAFAVCIDTSVKDNIAYLQTGDGNLWAMECDDADVGDVYRLVFDTHRTKKFTDDSIYSVRYIGYVFDVATMNDNGVGR